VIQGDVTKTEVEQLYYDELLEVASEIVECTPDTGGTWSLIPRVLLTRLQAALQNNGLNVKMRGR